MGSWGLGVEAALRTLGRSLRAWGHGKLLGRGLTPPTRGRKALPYSRMQLDDRVRRFLSRAPAVHVATLSLRGAAGALFAMHWPAAQNALDGVELRLGWTEIFKHPRRFLLWEGSISQFLDYENPGPIPDLDLHLVFQSEVAMRFDDLAVDSDPPQIAGTRRLGAGLEHPRHLQPLVESHGHVRSLAHYQGLLALKACRH